VPSSRIARGGDGVHGQRRTSRRRIAALAGRTQEHSRAYHFCSLCCRLSSSVKRWTTTGVMENHASAVLGGISCR